MELKLVKAILREILDPQGRLVSYSYLKYETVTTELEQCALTRAYGAALEAGRLNVDDLGQVAFINEKGKDIVTDDKSSAAVAAFFDQYKMLHPFAASQHMSEVGKILVAKRPVRDMLALLFNQEFADTIDTNKWLKVAQIACQPGRLYDEIVNGKVRYGVGDYTANVYIDEKRPDEDGIIFVSPEYWAEIIEAYSMGERRLHPGTTLVKVNSCDAHLAVKGLLMRATTQKWSELIERAGGRDDFQFVLCGNAIKHNDGSFEVGQIYEMTQQYFAWHSDSAMHRGHRVNVSKQVMTRSGMDTADFIRQAAGPAIERLKGLMQFDEEHVLKAIGAFSKDGQETSLETAAAVKKRIMEHLLPPNHPVNALQIFRLGMTVIREHIAKINVAGFHGMGGPSNACRGVVQVPSSVYKCWLKDYGHNRAYLFRSPYLGAYCGRYVSLTPANTDTILVNWEDALQMEGDFDGDQYYVVPAQLIKNAQLAEKPNRPAKGTKAAVALDTVSLMAAIVDQATNKSGIGRRDTLLSVAFDALYQARVDGNEDAIRTWSKNIELLQIYVQQAIEGLKHGATAVLTDADVKLMFKNGEAAHPYTELLANRAMRQNLQSTRVQAGYIDHVRMVVNEEYSGHPLHGIFEQIAQLKFGAVDQLRNYYPIINKQRTVEIKSTSVLKIYAHLRTLLKMYTKGVNNWDGGTDKNIKFSEHVLTPIRNKWIALTEAMCGNDRALRDLHLLLANVAYEPQPNWYLYSKDTRRLGLFVRMANGRLKRNLVNGKVRQALEAGGKTRVRLEPGKILINWVDTVHAGRFDFKIKQKLPRNGALFHHLADAKYVREILSDALPKISLDDLVPQLLAAARAA